MGPLQIHYDAALLTPVETRLALPPDWTAEVDALKLIARDRPTVLPLVPTVIQMLLEVGNLLAQPLSESFPANMRPEFRVVGAFLGLFIAFVATVFGAKENNRFTDESTGRIVHAELELAGLTLAVKDEGDGDLAPPTLGGSPVVMALYVDDADAVGRPRCSP